MALKNNKKKSCLKLIGGDVEIVHFNCLQKLIYDL